jgi:hypothetical protein
MAKNEDYYDVQEHLKILNRFYYDVTVILGLKEKKKKRKVIDEVSEVVEKTNKRLLPVMLLAAKEEQASKSKLNQEIFDLLKIKKSRKFRKSEKK